MQTREVIKRLFQFLLQFRLLLILSFLCAVSSVSLNVYAPLLIGDILDHMSRSMTIDFSIPVLIQLVLVYLLYSLFNWGMMFFSNKIAFSSSCVMRRQLHDKLDHLPISFYDQNAKGDLISRYVNDVDLISDGFLQGLSTMMSGVTTIALAIVFMLRIDVIMSVIVIASAPFTYGVARIITKRSQCYFRKQADALGKMNGYSAEMLSGIKTVKAYHYEYSARQVFHEYNQQLYESGVKSQFYGSLANPSTRFVTNFTYALVGSAGAFLALLSQITIGNISSFLIYANLFSKPFTEITGVMTQLQSAIASGKRIFSLFDLEEETNEASAAISKPVKGAIQFDHVFFSYQKNKALMQDICLSIEPGQKVAIVGKTGAGKTTFVNLLMRFYDVTKGTIRIDGVDITKMSREELRSCFGMVLQETYLFEGSIRENIVYGKTEATEQEILAAAKKSGAHEFIRRFPQGYDTILHANSNTLSSGQRQLLSLTRILLMDPAMLILDEATSSMDTVSERHVNEAMELLMKGRTSFVIAHRLSTILDADRILVMDHGDIIEQGTHKELMVKHGAYQALFQSQFA